MSKHRYNSIEGGEGLQSLIALLYIALVKGSH